MTAAIAFLTVLPVPGRAGVERRMLLAFPAVGLLIGGLWAVTAWLAGLGLPVIAVAGLVLAADIAVTGALHLDAVGDVGDGFAARRAGADATAALSDPRIGAVGVAVLVTVLLVRVALLTALVAEPWSAALWLAPVVGRAGMAAALWASPPPTGSLASGLATAATAPVLAGVVATTALLGAVAAGAGAATVPLLVAVVAGLAAALLVTRRGLAAFGRSGGDLVGAAGIAAETVALLALAWRG